MLKVTKSPNCFSMHPQYHDGLNFLSKCTPGRVWNAVKIFTSYFWSRLTAYNKPMGLPISLSVEPTTSCNLRCPECPSGLRSFTRATGMLSLEVYQKILDELHPVLWYLILYFQGEPYLHPQFFEMVKASSDRKIYTATSTNAHYLTSENARKTVLSGLDRLIISIDGTTQDTYESYRVGGSLDKVIAGTKQIVSWKKALGSKTPYLIFQFLVVKPNEHQVNEVKALATTLGVDKVVLKTAQIYDYQNGSSLIPENERYSRYRKNADGSYSLKNRLLNHCWKMWHSCVITWDGKVVPCCFDKDASHPMGNISNQHFHDLWFGEPYMAFRRNLMKARSEIDICTNCTEGMQVFN